MIADNKTNQEGTFKVGDTVQDAQLIRIFSNKIILLRNNGQQEVLYLREQDAKLIPHLLRLMIGIRVLPERTEHIFILLHFRF